MPGDDSDWLYILFFAGLALVLGGFAFVFAIEGWRQWSENRRIRKHLRR